MSAAQNFPGSAGDVPVRLGPPAVARAPRDNSSSSRSASGPAYHKRRFNNFAKEQGEHVWENESFDRVIRSEADLEEKFQYICRNPWDSQVAGIDEGYPWLWTPDLCSARAPNTAGEAPALPNL